MKKETDYAVEKFKKAAERLKQGISQAKDELGQDGIIQRFEFTFELMWKCLKVLLQEQGIITKSPKDSLKSAFQVGFIEEEQAFLDMFEDRNLASHLYSKEDSEAIFQRIKKGHLPKVEALLARLKKEA